MMHNEARPHLVIIGPYPPPHGGVEVHVARLHDFGAGMGFRTSTINISRHRSLGHREVYFPSTGLELLRLLFRLKPDVVHLHIGGDPSGRELLLCYLLGRLRLGIAVVTFHSGGVPAWIAKASWTFRRLLRAALGQADGVVTVNESIAGALAETQPRAVISVIPPHSYGHIEDGLARAPSLPGDLGRFTAGMSPRLVVVGGLEAEYRVDLALEVTRRLTTDYPGLGLVVIGDGSLRGELEAQIERTALGDHVFIAGDLGHDVTLRAIAESDAMLRLTTFDGDAISVREALFLGTPVVASDNGMRPEGVSLVGELGADEVVTQVATTLRRGRGRVGTESGDAHLEALFRYYRHFMEGPVGHARSRGSVSTRTKPDVRRR